MRVRRRPILSGLSILISYNGKNYTFLAVIPARAGSQGVKGKNFRPLMGKPLVEWSILAAMECPYIDLTLVSTNDPEIEKITEPHTYNIRHPQVRVLRRPDEIAGPKSHTEATLLHALHASRREFEFDPDFVITLQPTSPVRYNMLISCCIEELMLRGGDSLLTANCHTPLFWQKRNGKAYFIHNPTLRRMRQDYTEDEFLWHDNGNVYISSKEAIENGCRVGKTPVLYETTQFQSLQIDTEFDFELIEKMAQLKQGLI